LLLFARLTTSGAHSLGLRSWFGASGFEKYTHAEFTMPFPIANWRESLDHGISRPSGLSTIRLDLSTILPLNHLTSQPFDLLVWWSFDHLVT
jgi:hypothetical protein